MFVKVPLVLFIIVLLLLAGVHSHTHTNIDTDEDGITDKQEIRLGTDSTEKDTDDDGLKDGYEVYLNQSIKPDINPRKKTVLIEIDYTEQNKPDIQTLDTVKNTFKNAPVDSSSIEKGIEIVFIIDDELDVKENITISEYKKLHSEKLFDKRNEGFYHILMIDNPQNDSSTYGISDTSVDGFLLEKNSSSSYTASIMIHEIGHQLGLMPEDYKGIDTRKIEYENYSSIMNYNSEFKTTEFSKGNRFDDWSHIEESFPKNAPSTASVENDQLNIEPIDKY
jgi:hypothetical protein